MMKTNSLRDVARELALRPYVTIVLLDETTDDEPMYVALNPELNGCMAQGDTVEEARRNLDETRVDFIQHMLENELAVPEPRLITAKPIPASTQDLGSLFDRDILAHMVDTRDGPLPLQFRSEYTWLPAPTSTATGEHTA